MRSLLVLLVALPQLIFCDNANNNNNNNNNDNEKYTQNHLTPQSSLYCNDLNPQMHLDFNMLMGLWYGSEIITHHETEAYETVYDSCVVVHLADANEFGTDDYDYSNYDENNAGAGRRQYGHRPNYNFHASNRRLRLIWDEKGRSLEYTLRVDSARRGFWMTSGPQKGTMLDLPYSQFTGTVQVMKAVGNHLVLTFCETLPKSQMFTIILTRKPHLLSRDDVQSVRNLLRRRGLSTQSVRKVCRNSSTALNSSVLLTTLTFIIASFLNRKN
ncbi:hypothetical protein PVAND_009559 [Polypedilum vanderplanki]|uniref:Uncharacterized protein n=1 Tax=Polypedilum vanderplanki TaxID=319348 RepID=A0A9J6CDA0_POLVA|nr:hypothetical protein PVAND_009559 [Polypedilum vanderplanki]